MLTAIIPNLPSLDFDRTEAFYTRIGFARLGRHPDYMLLIRDGCELHFWACTDREIPKACGAYLRCADVDALQASIADVPGVTAVEAKPWGMTEFNIFDPDGNLLRVGIRTQPEARRDLSLPALGHLTDCIPRSIFRSAE